MSSTPDLKQIQHLIKLSDEKSYNLLKKRAVKLTKNYPKFYFGWLSLGVAYLHLDEYENAIQALNQSLCLNDRDQYIYLNIGLVFEKIERETEAEKAYYKAVEIDPNCLEALNNIGEILRKRGELEEAERIFTNIINIDRNFISALSNLSLVHSHKHKNDQAIKESKLAVSLEPENDKFLVAQAEVFKNIGQVKQAICSLNKAISINSKNCFAILFLGDMLVADCNYVAALEAYQTAEMVDSNHFGLIACVSGAIINYLRNENDIAKRKLENSNKIFFKKSIFFKNNQSYHRLLTKLLEDKKEDILHHNDQTKIYSIGESHVLSTSFLDVHYNKHACKIIAEWMPGIKQFHLSKKEYNIFKYKFEEFMKKLPSRSVVLTCIGEIDCRYDEGIFRKWMKDKTTDIKSLTKGTVVGYLDYLGSFKKSYDHEFIVCGTPAPHSSRFKTADSNEFVANDTPAPQIRREIISQIDVDIYLENVKFFNQFLKEEASLRNMGFLDIYNETISFSEGGLIENKPSVYIDDYHVFPQVYLNAFQKLEHSETMQNNKVL